MNTEVKEDLDTLVMKSLQKLKDSATVVFNEYFERNEQEEKYRARDHTSFLEQLPQLFYTEDIKKALGTEVDLDKEQVQKAIKYYPMDLAAQRDKLEFGEAYEQCLKIFFADVLKQCVLRKYDLSKMRNLLLSCFHPDKMGKDSVLKLCDEFSEVTAFCCLKPYMDGVIFLKKKMDFSVFDQQLMNAEKWDNFVSILDEFVPRIFARNSENEKDIDFFLLSELLNLYILKTLTDEQHQNWKQQIEQSGGLKKAVEDALSRFFNKDKTNIKFPERDPRADLFEKAAQINWQLQQENDPVKRLRLLCYKIMLRQAAISDLSRMNNPSKRKNIQLGTAPILLTGVTIGAAAFICPTYIAVAIISHYVNSKYHTNGESGSWSKILQNANAYLCTFNQAVVYSVTGLSFRLSRDIFTLGDYSVGFFKTSSKTASENDVRKYSSSRELREAIGQSIERDIARMEKQWNIPGWKRKGKEKLAALKEALCELKKINTEQTMNEFLKEINDIIQNLEKNPLLNEHKSNSQKLLQTLQTLIQKAKEETECKPSESTALVKL